MGAGASSLLKDFKAKLYNAMGSNNSIPIRTDDLEGSSIPRRNPVDPQHPYFTDIAMCSFHQMALNQYIQGNTINRFYRMEVQSALNFTSLKAGHLDPDFDSNVINLANVQRAHMLLALHRLSLEGRGR